MSKTSEGQDFIKVDRLPKDGRCFICRRTPEEIDSFIDVSELKSEIANALTKKKRPASLFDPSAFKSPRTRFETTTIMVPYDFRGQKLMTSRSFPHYELQYHPEGSDVPVEADHVVEVIFHLPVCPFCSKLLDDASRASYKTIHAQDHCEDD